MFGVSNVFDVFLLLDRRNILKLGNSFPSDFFKWSDKSFHGDGKKQQRGISPFVDIFEVYRDPSSFVIEKIGSQKQLLFIFGEKVK